MIAEWESGEIDKVVEVLTARRLETKEEEKGPNKEEVSNPFKFSLLSDC